MIKLNVSHTSTKEDD